MKIFVTVGTTAYPKLFESLQPLSDRDWQFVCQTSEDKAYYGMECFRFSLDIEQYANEAQLIITHAGAGSVFRMLEEGRKILIVPNLARQDKHQLDLAKYCEQSSFAKVCYKLDSIEQSIKEAIEFEPLSYEKADFFMSEEIISSVRNAWT